jgi:hypothetical protein
VSGYVLEGILKEPTASQGIAAWALTRSRHTALGRILLEEVT